MTHRTPAEYARWVREFHGMSDVLRGPFDASELVSRCGGRVDEAAVRGFSGLLVPEEPLWGILLNEDESRRRKRFTIAHELGHFCIPTHKKRALLCLSPDVSRSSANKAPEREANEFAAELLLPRREVAPMVSHGAINVQHAGELAETFDVSATSAALRMCELSSERSAVLYYRSGLLKWAFRFGGMPFGTPNTGTAPLGGTLAHDILSGGDGSAGGREVNLAQWLPLGEPERWRGALLESSVALDDTGEILTVLWLPDSD